MEKGSLYTLGKSKNTTSSNSTLILLILVLSAISITPMLQVGKYLLVLWCAFIFITLNQFIKADLRLRHIAQFGVSFILLCTFYWWIGISSANFGYCISGPFLCFSPIFALIVIDNCNNDDQIKFIFHMLSLIIAINIIYSIWIFLSLGIEDVVFQNLAEENGEDVANGSKYGGAMYVNMIVFYASVVYMAFVNSSHKVEKLIFLIYFIISAYFIIICSLKASAILLLIGSIVMQHIAYRGERNIKFFLLLTFILIGLFLSFKDNIINFLIDLIGSERIASRLEVFLTGAKLSDNTSYEGREMLWETSLNSWLRDPISFFVGIGDHDWTTFATTEDSGIGYHSDFIDILARYGLLGGGLFYSALFLFYKYTQEKFGKLFKWEILSFFALIILMGLTKRFMEVEPPIIIFILFPACLKYLSVTVKCKK